ncbi:MAG: TatD family hydrolase [Desulfamplus sp.]|nr:TatD family hydrolase [Desulfamplus sp.]
MTEISPGAAFFDAHCHLQEPEITDSLDDIMERWQGIGGGTIVCCGTREPDWRRVLEIADIYKNVLPCLGLHPWFIPDIGHGTSGAQDLDNTGYASPMALKMSGGGASMTPKMPGSGASGAAEFGNSFDCLDKLEAMLERLEAILDANPSIAGIGETGLDLLVKDIDPVLQERVFMAHMTMARERNLPVSIHVRKGWDRLMVILKKTGALPRGGLIHSYSGSADMVPMLERYGLYISFSGSVTKQGNKKVKKALASVSPDRLLIETDSPAILPESPCRLTGERTSPDWNMPDEVSRTSCRLTGERTSPLYLQGWNEPANITMIAASAANILGVPLSRLMEMTWQNGIRLFSLG